VASGTAQVRNDEVVTGPSAARRSPNTVAVPQRLDIAPTWSTWRDAMAVVGYRPHLRKTVALALLVGTVLFCINHLDVVVRGDATALVWGKGAITYLVPFGVSNAGLLVASRRPR
jgi:hypothetical protein